MSQTDTYRPAVHPPESVMMPATDAPDAPPPAAQTPVPNQDPAMTPAQTRSGSLALERLRNRMRSLVPQTATWFDARQMPLDQRGATAAGGNATTAQQMLEPSATPLSRSFTQGAALSTLMRSATRQHRPALLLTEPPSVAMNAQGPAIQPTVGQPQMRGALRQVVRNAQQQPAVYPVVPKKP